jgi:hypothetical protein
MGRGQRYTVSAHQHSARCAGRGERMEQGWRTHSIVCTVLFTLSASARATAPSFPMLLSRPKLEEYKDQVSGGACRDGQRTTAHRVSTPTLCTLHRVMGADRAREVHSLDTAHRLVHLERLGQSNSSLGTDAGVTQAGGIQRSSKWWCMQRWAKDNGTPCLHTNTLHAAQGDGSGQSKGGALTRSCAPSGSP